MRHYIGVIVGCLAAFCVASSWADEEYDPAVYPELSEKQAAENAGAQQVQTPIQKSMAKTSLSPTQNGSVIDAPKFVDDEEMNFDNVGNAFEDDKQMAEPVEIPMLQKSAVQLSTEPQPSSGQETQEDEKLQEIGIVVDENQPLTENIKVNDGKNPSSKAGETWINKLAEKAENKVEAGQKVGSPIQGASMDANLESMVEKAKKRNRRSNASVFDISGAMLRMSFKQIDETLTRRGFRPSMQKMDIPNFIRWRNEDKCRAAGVVGYERLENCVIKIAQRDKHQYVERAAYTKYDTKETIEVRFTSNFTGNKAYRISYKSEAANITGNSQKAIYLRNIKVYDFWKKINQKYGNPDNRDDVIWGLGGNKPYLQAATGRLVLEDPMLSELDYTRMSREDQRYMNTDLYSF